MARKSFTLSVKKVLRNNKFQAKFQIWRISLMIHQHTINEVKDERLNVRRDSNVVVINKSFMNTYRFLHAARAIVRSFFSFLLTFESFHYRFDCEWANKAQHNVWNMNNAFLLLAAGNVVEIFRVLRSSRRHQNWQCRFVSLTVFSFTVHTHLNWVLYSVKESLIFYGNLKVTAVEFGVEPFHKCWTSDYTVHVGKLRLEMIIL